MPSRGRMPIPRESLLLIDRIYAFELNCVGQHACQRTRNRALYTFSFRARKYYRISDYPDIRDQLRYGEKMKRG